MNDTEFISYCRAHCRTEIGMFFGSDVNRLVRLAGLDAIYAELPPNAPRQLGPAFVGPLCDLATIRLEHAEAVSRRETRQRLTHEWCAAAFGTDHAASIPQRGIRLAEEAIEAAQAAGCDVAMVHKLVDHVYSKPAGALSQELGGVGITLLALAQAAGLSADQEESREFVRVTSKPMDHFRARNEAKNQAGFNVTPVDPR